MRVIAVFLSPPVKTVAILVTCCISTIYALYESTAPRLTKGCGRSVGASRARPAPQCAAPVGIRSVKYGQVNNSCQTGILGTSEHATNCRANLGFRATGFAQRPERGSLQSLVCAAEGRRARRRSPDPGSSQRVL